MPQDQAFNEWQYPRISSFIPVLLFIPAVWIVGAPFNTDAGFFVGLGFALLTTVLKLSNSKHIRVTKAELKLGNASIPRKVLGKAMMIAKDDQFAARGVNLDARAFVFIKYGLPEMVRIENLDPSDPTPYLLVSTRKAKELVDALN